MVRTIAFAAVAISLTAMVSAEALAQRLPEDLNLNRQDLDIMRETARTALNDEPDGSTLEWENPQTGNSGTVTVVRSFEYQGLPCRRIRHAIKTKGVADVHGAEWTQCQKDGAWKIAD